MTSGSEQNKNLSPELRFSQFSEPWTMKGLSSLVDDMRGGAALTPADFVAEGECRVIPKKAIGSGGKLQLGADLTCCTEEFFFSNPTNRIDSSFLVTTLRDLVPSGPTIGYIVTFDEVGEFILAQGVYGFKVKSEFAVPEFLAAYSNRSEYRRLMRALKVGSTQVHIRNGDFLSQKITLPNAPEQRRIASFIGAVDDKISQLHKKKALLEDYKKGCMQKLFSRELRFKDADGKGFPHWEEKPLGGVAKIYDGTHQTPKYVESGIPFFSVEQVTSNDFTQTKFVAEAVYENECRRVKIDRNDILLTRIGDIGTAKLVDWDVRASFYVSLALVKTDGAILPSFAVQFFTSDFFQRELWHRTIHVAFPKKINLGEIGNCRIRVPALPEQQKIAEFLSAIDSKIQLVTTEIKQTQTFKKGLLQQMFV